MIILNRILCIFGIHDWVPFKVHHYYDTSYGGRCSSTTVIWKCRRCGCIKHKDFYGVGFIELKDLL